MEHAQRRGFLHSRAGRVLLFVAIVWSVAGSFIAFEIAALGGMGFLLSKPEFAGNLALSNAARDSKTCTVEAGANGTGGHTPAEVRVTAWLMGLNIGRDGIARQSASVDRNTLAEVMKMSRRWRTRWAFLHRSPSCRGSLPMPIPSSSASSRRTRTKQQKP